MRAVLRLASFLALLAAFVMLIVDGTTTISAQSLSFTSIEELVARFGAPEHLDNWGASLSRNLHPMVWGVIQLLVLAVPAVLAFAVVGLVCWILGRRGEPDLDMTRRE